MKSIFCRTIMSMLSLGLSMLMTFNVLLPQIWAQEVERDQKFSLSVTVKAINLLAAVVDQKGKVVHNLKKEDFVLWEDDQKQIISHFITHEQAPLSIAVLLDSSGSMSYSGKLSNSKLIIERLAKSLNRKDEMALFTFSELFVRTKVPFTRDKELIIRKLSTVKSGGNTALYQALHFMPQIMGEPQNRQAILLFTDGIDNQSIISLTQVVKNTRQMQIPIYSLGFAFKAKKNRTPPVDYAFTEILETIASDTGGRYFELANAEELAPSIKNIMTELRYQYLIGYYSNQRAQPGTYHTLRLETTNKEYRVKTRKGYYIAE
ncbi:VWA domain-containing protein [candidate division CSSED10-310 bacterium]|uniref:VWA domain-containing protein n=1 Tax=candidate division CSSED10-310 bacterium TaxID=2855610 RepID=A0ABV6YTA5_UNCC1